jgi:hypothetical protein
MLSSQLRKFPNDFINISNCSLKELPTDNLILGKKFFSKYEILDIQGNTVALLESIYLAKYLIYSKCRSVLIPKLESDIENSVKNYETYIDRILKEIIKDHKKEFPKIKNNIEVINKIFNSLNLKRY